MIKVVDKEEIRARLTRAMDDLNATETARSAWVESKIFEHEKRLAALEQRAAAGSRQKVEDAGSFGESIVTSKAAAYCPYCGRHSGRDSHPEPGVSALCKTCGCVWSWSRGES